MTVLTRPSRGASLVLSCLMASGLVASGTAAVAADGGSVNNAPAAKYDTKIRVTDDGWIHYPSRLKAIGVEFQKTGKKTERAPDGSCFAAGEGESSSAGVTYSEQLAFNPKTCESLYGSSELNEEQTRKLDATMKTKDKGQEQSPGGTAPTTPPDSSDFTAMGTYGPYSRYLQTIWEDPIQIDISWQKVGLSWNSAAWTHRLYDQDSFKGTVNGVTLDNTYVVSINRSIAGTGNGWQENAKTHFRNTSFGYWVLAVVGPVGWAACGAPTNSQANFYHNGTVRGYAATGTASWNYNDTKDGACTNLVHHDERTGTY